MDQMIYDNVSGQYMRLAHHNLRPESALVGCAVRWFKYVGHGYKCVDGGSGLDASECFKAYDVSGVGL